MPAREIKTRFKLEGESEYRRAMTDAANAIKVLNSEEKLAAAQYEATGDAQQYAAEQARILKEQINQQERAVEAAEKAIKQLTENGVDKNSKQMQTWRTKLNSAKTSLLNMQNRLDKVGTELGEEQQAFKNTQTSGEEFDKSLKDIGKGVNFQNTIDAIDTITTHIETIVKTAAKAAKAVWEMGVDAGAWADNLATAASQMGVDPETYQSWQYASRFIDTSVEDIQRSWQDIQKKLKEGNTEYLGQLAKLGIASMKTNGQMRESSDIFWDAIDYLHGISDSSAQASKASELFGNDWRRLNPLIEAGSKAYKDLADEGRSVAVVSNENVAALGAVDDAVQDMNARFDKLKYDTLAELAPMFKTTAEALSTAVTALNEFVQSEEGQAALSSLNDAVSGLITSFLGDDNGKGTFESIVTKAKEAVTGFTQAVEWISNNGGTVTTLIEGLGAAWATLKVTKEVLTFLQLLKQIPIDKLTSIFGGGKASAEGMNNAASGAANAVKNAANKSATEQAAKAASDSAVKSANESAAAAKSASQASADSSAASSKAASESGSASSSAAQSSSAASSNAAIESSSSSSASAAAASDAAITSAGQSSQAAISAGSSASQAAITSGSASSQAAITAGSRASQAAITSGSASSRAAITSGEASSQAAITSGSASSSSAAAASDAAITSAGTSSQAAITSGSASSASAASASESAIASAGASSQAAITSGEASSASAAAASQAAIESCTASRIAAESAARLSAGGSGGLKLPGVSLKLPAGSGTGVPALDNPLKLGSGSGSGVKLSVPAGTAAGLLKASAATIAKILGGVGIGAYATLKPVETGNNDLWDEFGNPTEEGRSIGITWKQSEDSDEKQAEAIATRNAAKAKEAEAKAIADQAAAMERAAAAQEYWDVMRNEDADLDEMLEAYENFHDAYIGFGDEFIKIKQNIDDLYNSGVLEDIEKLPEDLPSEWFTFGENAAIGLANGIDRQAWQAISAARAMAAAVSRNVRTTLMIQSPSKVMEGLGEYTALGFAEGIDHSVSSVERAVGRMVDATMRPVSYNPGYAMETVQAAAAGRAAGQGAGDQQMIDATIVMDRVVVGRMVAPVVNDTIGAIVSAERM